MSQVLENVNSGEFSAAPAGGERGESCLGLSVLAWAKIGIVAILFVALFRFNLVRLWLKTNPFTGEPNWGHAVCIPFIGLYYLYIHREELLLTPVNPLRVGQWTRMRIISAAAVIGAGLLAWLLSMLASSDLMERPAQALIVLGLFALLLNWGLGTLLFGILLFLYGIWPGQNDFLKDVGMVVALFGVVSLLTGWDVVRIVWFPIAFLVCGIPWPGLVYSWIAGPLQVLAAQVAVGVLQFTGVTAGSSGTKIFIGGFDQQMRTLNVAEACAGLRSLMTFISVGAAVAFLSSRRLWQKAVITLSAIPIAIFCNVMRVSGQGLLDHYVSQELSQSFAHQFVGLIMLVPAFFLILLVGWALDQIWVEELRNKRELTDQVITRGNVSSAVVLSQSPARVAPTPPPPPRVVPVRINRPTGSSSAPRVPVARPITPPRQGPRPREGT